MTVQLGPYVLDDTQFLAEEIGAAGQTFRLRGHIIGNPVPGVAMEAHRAGVAGMAGNPLVNVALSPGAGQDGWYRITDAQVDQGPGAYDPDAGTVAWPVSLSGERVAQGSSRAASSLYGGGRPEPLTVWPTLSSAWRPYVGIPSTAVGLELPSAVNASVQRVGPRGTVNVHYVSAATTGLYNSQHCFYRLPPANWWDMAAMVTDSGGRPITTPLTALPSSWWLDNGICRLTFTSGIGFRLFAPNTSNPVNWNTGWALYMLPSLVPATSLNRAMLIQAGPELAVVRVEFTDGIGTVITADLSLRRGDRGVHIDAVSPTAMPWTMVAPSTITTAVSLSSQTIGRRTSVAVGGSRLVVLMLDDTHTAPGTSLIGDTSKQRSLWWIGAEYDGASAVIGDTAGNVATFAIGGAREILSVGA